MVGEEGGKVGRLPEEWRQIPGYEGRYEVSSEGRVRSIDHVIHFQRAGRPAQRRHKGMLLTPCPNLDGYPHVPLRIGGKLRLITVHRLVCRTFHGEPTKLHNEVAHLDGSRTNARADNLKWASKVENEFHKNAHGTRHRGDKVRTAKLTQASVVAIKDALLSGARPCDLARDYGVSADTIRDIARYRRWRTVGHQGKIPSAGYQGSPGTRNPGASLTAARVLSIRARGDAGERCSDIARDLKITKSIISNVLRRKSYRDVPEAACRISQGEGS